MFFTGFTDGDGTKSEHFPPVKGAVGRLIIFTEREKSVSLSVVNAAETGCELGLLAVLLK